jgi:hypothetical protein
MTLAESLLLAQGSYYAISGLWPLVSMRTFLSVTGPKTDLWLVKTVGLLVLAIGMTLLAAAWRGTLQPEIVMLAVGSAVALIAVDVVYSVKRVISYVYLADAAAEGSLIWLWAMAAAGAR